jgi:hypothetical protein
MDLNDDVVLDVSYNDISFPSLPLLFWGLPFLLFLQLLIAFICYVVQDLYSYNNNRYVGRRL